VSFFEPLPPPPNLSERHWSAPTWDRPSEETLPTTLAVNALVSQGDDALVVIPSLDVFPNGFRINLVIMVNPHRAPDIHQMIRGGPMHMPRVGVRFADGRVGGRDVRHGRFDLPKDQDGVPAQPFVGHAGGGGGSGGWRFGVWVYPLPPDGPLEIFVALPPPASLEASTTVDGSAIRAAAEQARAIWA
jgi:hypothetical protein